jgi:hypothetical protein
MTLIYWDQAAYPSFHPVLFIVRIILSHQLAEFLWVIVITRVFTRKTVKGSTDINKRVNIICVCHAYYKICYYDLAAPSRREEKEQWFW